MSSKVIDAQEKPASHWSLRAEALENIATGKSSDAIFVSYFAAFGFRWKGTMLTPAMLYRADQM